MKTKTTKKTSKKKSASKVKKCVAKKSTTKKHRKIRKDCTVKTLREKYGLEFLNDTGKRTRSDKKVATIRRENKAKKRSK